MDLETIICIFCAMFCAGITLYQILQMHDTAARTGKMMDDTRSAGDTLEGKTGGNGADEQEYTD